MEGKGGRSLLHSEGEGDSPPKRASQLAYLFKYWVQECPVLQSGPRDISQRFNGSTIKVYLSCFPGPPKNVLLVGVLVEMADDVPWSVGVCRGGGQHPMYLVQFHVLRGS